MSKGRKTIEVEKLVEFANMLLAHDKVGDANYRLGVIAMVEHALFLSNQYDGYAHLTKNQLPEDITPGVDWDTGSPIIRDDTRRRYL